MNNASYLLQLTFHGLCEWVAALGTTLWISQSWSQSPAPFPISLMKSPPRVWLMVGCGLAPAGLSMLMYPLIRQLYASGGASAWIPISYGLSVLYGALVGLAASCCVAPSDPQRDFRSGAAVTVSTLMILAFYLLSAFLLRQFFIHEVAAMVVPVAILFVARSIVAAEAPAGAEPPAVPAAPPLPRKLWPALLIGFLPSALFLIVFAVAFSTSNLSKDASNALLWMCSGVSVVCCFTASIMLFTRHTAGAITGGIMFLLLNAFIGFFFGCCASLNGTSFH